MPAQDAAASDRRLDPEALLTANGAVEDVADNPDFPAGEEGDKDDLAIIAKIPRWARQQVQRMHRGLGHPSKAAERRFLNLCSKATDQQKLYSRLWKCPVCLARQKPVRCSKAAFRADPGGSTNAWARI